MGWDRERAAEEDGACEKRRATTVVGGEILVAPSPSPSLRPVSAQARLLVALTLPADSAIVEVRDAVMGALADRSDGERESYIFDGCGVPGVAESDSTDPPGATRLAAYDLTYHPPEDVTGSFAKYAARSGAGSKTLQGMGWFPSGRVVVVLSDGADGARESVASGRAGSRALEEDEGQYNRLAPACAENPTDAPGGIAAGGLRVMLRGESADSLRNGGTVPPPPKPSEVFRSVAARFDGDDEGGNGAASLVPRPPPRRHRTEAERQARLNEAMRSLDERVEKRGGAKKKGGASEQVRRMLFKSRAVGDTGRLKEQDRFYLEVAVVNEIGEKGRDENIIINPYRFYSRESSAGRVAADVSRPITSGRDREVTSEMLVTGMEQRDGCPPPSPTYLRLPHTMTLREAERGRFLGHFDRVLVRVFSVDEEPSPSILKNNRGSPLLLEAELVEKTSGNVVDKDLSAANSLDATGSESKFSGRRFGVQADAEGLELFRRLSSAVEKASEEVASGRRKSRKDPKKKKLTASSEKVRQMLIKSRAAGDKRRVKDEADRFYLEVVFVVPGGTNTGDSVKATSSYRFYHKNWDLETLVETVKMEGSGAATATSKVLDSEILVECDVLDTVGQRATGYLRLSGKIPLCEAVAKGYLKPFQRVVIRQYLDDSNHIGQYTQIGEL